MNIKTLIGGGLKVSPAVPKVSKKTWKYPIHFPAPKFPIFPDSTGIPHDLISSGGPAGTVGNPLTAPHLYRAEYHSIVIYLFLVRLLNGLTFIFP